MRILVLLGAWALSAASVAGCSDPGIDDEATTYESQMSVDEQIAQALPRILKAACEAEYDWERTPDSSHATLTDVIGENSHYASYLFDEDAIVEQASKTCPQNFVGYDGWKAERDAEDEVAEPTDEPVEPADEPVDADLAERGLTHADVVQLGRAADVTGYGLSKDTPLSYEQAENFAFVIVGVCDSVASGESTWEDEVDQAVLDGAPTTDAEQFNAYLREAFCPRLS